MLSFLLLFAAMLKIGLLTIFFTVKQTIFPHFLYGMIISHVYLRI
jgi:hypothetical protein